jgi:hypothetical protein
MKNVKTLIGAILVASAVFTSCGPSPDDYKTENLKSTCDCVKMKTDLIKITNDLLEGETDKASRTELIESDDYKDWTKKKSEVGGFCSKTFSDNLEEIKKCPEYEMLFKELERDRKLHE